MKASILVGDTEGVEDGGERRRGFLSWALLRPALPHRGATRQLPPRMCITTGLALRGLGWKSLPDSATYLVAVGLTPAENKDLCVHVRACVFVCARVCVCVMV